MTIRLARAEDAAAIAAIYGPYVSDTIVSFENAAPDAAEMRRRIESGGDLHPWLAACSGEGDVVGFANASPFRPRHAYRFTV